MGLDTTHNCWHGPYSMFNRFRHSLGHQIGIDLNDYIGYSNPNATKQLESIKHDIRPLLNHSDCDGEITVEQCKLVANGLNSILENFNHTIEMDDNFKEQIIEFRKGCILAIKNNEVVEFR